MDDQIVKEKYLAYWQKATNAPEVYIGTATGTQMLLFTD